MFNFKKARIDRGITVMDLAEMVDVSTQTIWRWENGGGEPRASSIKKLAEALDVSTDYLLKVERHDS